MKIFTFFSLCLIPIFSTILSAAPILSTHSLPSDTLCLELEVGADSEPFSSVPPAESAADTPPPSFSVIGDFCGQGTGSIDLTPDPNTPGPWTFIWSNGATTEDISGLTAGTYTVIVTDANGNAQAEQIVVNNLPPAPPPNTHAVFTPNTVCVGAFDGAIDLTVTPFTAPWTYLWSTGATTQDISGLNSGIYFVSITIGVTCTTVHQFEVPDGAGAPVIVLPAPANGVVASTCEQANGVAGVLVTGGVQPFTYMWSNGGTNVAIQNVLAGTYTITVTGANGCTDTEELTVPNINWPIVIEDSEVIIVPNTTCIGGNGSISIPIVHPIIHGPFDFAWDNGATTQTISNLTSGSYRVTVTFTPACFTSQVYYVPHEPLIPDIHFTNTPTTCGLSNGFVNLTVLPGGTPPYIYTWSNGATTQDLNNVPADTYNVTITGANGCPIIGSATIEDTPTLFSYSALVTDHNACDTTNGQINLSLFPNTLAYQWSNGATGTLLRNLAPGEYTVTISAGGTCTAVETYYVGEIPEYPIIPLTTIPSTCGLSNGSVDLTVLGYAEPPIKYLWSNGATTQDLVGIPAGTYSVTVTSALGCSAENLVTVPNLNDTLTVLGTVTDNLSCLATTGNIALSVDPQNSSYTFLWSNGETTDTLSYLSAGTYLVTVTLGISCISVDTFVVNDNAMPPNLTLSNSAAHCSLNNGAASVNISGGTGPFGILWSTSDTTQSLNNLPPGTYTVTVSGANGCTEVQTVTVPNDDATPDISGIPTANTACDVANGALDLSMSPVGTYQYLWSTTATTEDIAGLSPGTYTVTVSLGSCLTSSAFVIPDHAEAPDLATTSTAATCSQSNGSAEVGVTAGTGPFDILWSTSSVNNLVNGLSPGTYTVTVTGAHGCSSESTVTVANTDIPLAVSAISGGNNSCTDPDGTLDISVSPVGTYVFQWSNNGTDEDLDNLASGSYTVTVTLGTCQSVGTFSVPDQTATPDLSAAIIAAICSSDNGGIDLEVSGTTGPFGFLWSNMATTEDIDGLFPGDYTVTVSAPNGCTGVATLTVPNNASTFGYSGAVVPLTDCATNNGAIDLSISTTGSGTFSFLWSNMATTEDLDGLAPGTYTVSITESGICTVTATYTVQDQRSIPTSTQSIVPEFCGLSDGSVDLSIAGGTAPFTYLWDNGVTTQDLANIPQGTYAVTVSDTNNCTLSAIVLVPETTVPFALSGVSSPNSSCVLNNGGLDLSVTGNGNFSYTWSNQATTEDLNGLSAGTYSVTVSAGGNCTQTGVFVVASDVPTPALSSNIVASFCGQANGGIDLSVAGSPSPHGYVWSNLALSEDLNGLVSGNYAVTVTAANGCTAIGQFTVPETTVIPNISGITVATNSCTAFNGAIDLSVDFSDSFTILWSNGSQSEDLVGLGPGVYSVTIDGGSSCVGTAVFNIADQTTQPLAGIAASAAILDCISPNSTLVGSVTGTGNPTQLLWHLNGTQIGSGGSIVVSAPGQYVLTVLDELTSCADTTSVTIGQNQQLPDLTVGTPMLLTCTNPAQTLLGSSMLNGISFTWATIVGPDTTLLGSGPSLSVSTAGTYFLFGHNPANHCSNAVAVTVAADQNDPVANAGQPFELDCAGETASLNGSGSGGNSLGFLWNSPDGHIVSGATTPTPFIDEPGTYVLLVTNLSNGCTASSVVVIETEIPVAYASVTQPTCLQPRGTARVDSVKGLSGTIWYSIDNGPPVAQNQFAGLEPGVYTLMVLGGNGCNASTAVSVEPHVPLVVTLEPSVTVVLGYGHQIEATVNIPDSEIASVSWTPADHLDCDSCLSTLATPLNSTKYEVVVVSNGGCADRGSITVVVDKTRRVYGPNIFSPNGDGSNDFFSIFGDPVTVESVRSLQIFSRWGEAVYERRNFAPDDEHNGWDGTFRGQKMNPGVFIWQAVVRFVDGYEELFTGDVSLMR